jgi:hypothetical protein
VRATGFSERTVSVPPRDYLLAGRPFVAAAERDVDDSTREALAEAPARSAPSRGLARRVAPHPGQPVDARWWLPCARATTSLLGRQRRGLATQLPFHELAQQNRGVVCAMNLSLLEGLLAGLETNNLSPSLEIDPGPFCVLLRPRPQKQPPL